MTEPNNESKQPSAFDYPEVREAFLQFAQRIPDLLEEKIKGEFRTRRTGSIGIAVFVVLVIGSVLTLAILDKLSSDAIGFMFGTIVGASFTYLRNLLPS